MKKIISMLMVVCLVVAMLAGCSKAAAPAPATPSTPATPAAPAAPAKPAAAKEFTVAYITQANTAEGRATESFKKQVEANSKGEVSVPLFPAAALGDEKANLEQLKVGEIGLSIVGELVWSQFAPAYNAIALPYIMPNIEEVYKFIDKHKAEIDKLTTEKGGVLIAGNQMRGARYLTCNKEIKTVADLKGMKLRVPEIADWVTIWKTLGVTPTPIAWPEVYSALQTKVADGQENPLSNITSAKLYEVQKYLVNTQHLQPVFNWVLSIKAVSEFSDANQKIIKDAITACAKAGDADSKAEQETLLKQCTDKGMILCEVDTAAFQKMAAPGVKEVSKTWAPGVYDELKKFFE